MEKVQISEFTEDGHYRETRLLRNEIVMLRAERVLMTQTIRELHDKLSENRRELSRLAQEKASFEAKYDQAASVLAGMRELSAKRLPWWRRALQW